MRAGIVREGDEIRLAGEVFTVLALSGGAVRLMNAAGERCSVPLSQLRADPTLELVSSSWPPLCSEESLSGVPPEVADRARWWERHLIEVLTGTGDARSGVSQPKFDVSVTTLRQRELAKVEELRAAGHDVSFKTLQRQRRAYERDGLLGVVDRRYLPQRAVFGRVDQRVVEVARRLVDAETDQSTGTVRRFRRGSVPGSGVSDGGVSVPDVRGPSRESLW
ncbi:hypothetical protein [Mycobacterium avium]|uniref:hypothetical protein n=1 Tax=Mycobacterium avium TaxID=1764 RepID=UPI0015CCF69A|nr:hypothetical protein [Mycobacterium avium]